MPEIPQYYKRVLTSPIEEKFVSALIGLVIYNIEPEITPAIWQNAAIYVRFRKRGVWTLSDERMYNGLVALVKYRVKFLEERMGKTGILEILNELFDEANVLKMRKSIDEIIEKRLHAPIDDFLMIQEERIVSKDELKDFDKIFAYPGWLEFDDGARAEVYRKILNDELSAEQVSYYLGSSERYEHFVELYPVAKHILETTTDPQLFWTAGDVLNMIWIAAPESMEKWFRDEIFEIFWPRVKNAWVIANVDKITETDETLILRDSIGWLKSLDDLMVRLPELKELGFTKKNLNLGDAEKRFSEFADGVERQLDEAKVSGYDFSNLAEETRTEENLERFEMICERIKKMNQESQGEGIEISNGYVDAVLRRTRKDVEDFLRERRDIEKYLGKKIKGKE